MSGGLIYGYAFYGALQQLHRDGAWSGSSLKSIHANSVGSVVAIFVTILSSIDEGAASKEKSECNVDFDRFPPDDRRSSRVGDLRSLTGENRRETLNPDIWATIDRYLIDRPWQDVFPLSISAFVRGYERCGIMDSTCFRDIFGPFFASYDVPIDITLGQFYERFHKELYFMTVCLGNGEDGGQLVELSHFTHPQWTVLDACYASCCAPIFFQPFIKDGRIYTDGCLSANYPMPQCVARYGHEPDFSRKTLGIYIELSDPISSETVYVTPPDLMTYLSQIVQFVVHKSNRLEAKCHDTGADIGPCTELNIDTSLYPYTDLYKFIHSPEDRTFMIAHGMAAAAALASDPKDPKDLPVVT